MLCLIYVCILTTHTRTHTHMLEGLEASIPSDACAEDPNVVIVALALPGRSRIGNLS